MQYANRTKIDEIMLIGAVSILDLWNAKEELVHGMLF